MMQDSKKVIIVGQGISGTMLSWFLHQAGVDFVIIDQENPHTPSQTAAGIINPVTGRRVVTVWMDDIILPFAEKTYGEIGAYLQCSAFTATNVVDFFPNPFMRESFLKKLSQEGPYLHLIEDENYLSSYFHYEFGAGSIAPAYIVHLDQLLPSWRHCLTSKDQLINESFDFTHLNADSGNIIYKDITATDIVFCDGAAGYGNPYFSLLPFALNKGEAIIIEAPDLPAGHIYKKSMTLAPYGEPGIFWAGTNYIWEFDDALPTQAFRESAEQTLKSWLKIPFKIIDHKAAIRPATVERRPFAGFHPLYPHIGILNGMGTKGCSLAPYFAQQLVNNMLQGSPIEKEADIARHARLLMRASMN